MDVSPLVSSSIAAGAATGNIPATPGTTGNASPAIPAAKGAAGLQSSAQQVAQAVAQVNDLFSRRGQNLYAAFGKDQSTGISVVKIIDRNTNDVINQMPSAGIVAFAQSLEHSQGRAGQLVNVRA